MKEKTDEGKDDAAKDPSALPNKDLARVIGEEKKEKEREAQRAMESPSKQFEKRVTLSAQNE